MGTFGPVGEGMACAESQIKRNTITMDNKTFIKIVVYKLFLLALRK